MEWKAFTIKANNRKSFSEFVPCQFWKEFLRFGNFCKRQLQEFRDKKNEQFGRKK